MEINLSDSTRHDSTYAVVDYNNLEGLFYISDNAELRIYFNNIEDDFRIVLDNDTSDYYSNHPIVLTELKRGDHSLTLYKSVDGEIVQNSKMFKIKKSTPLITNDATVFGLLMIVLFLIFKSTKLNIFKGFYKYVPALLLCYFIPAGLNSTGIVSSEESNLYFIASRYLLPASLILLCLSIDLKSLVRLGPKALIMFFTGGIIIAYGMKSIVIEDSE